MLNYLDIELREDERLIQQTVREFVEREALPLLRPCFAEGRFPSELIAPMAELGLLGATLPEYGAGVGPVGYGMICQELERGDSGLRSFVSAQSSLCMFPIYKYGSEAQRRRYLPEMARGRLIGCFGLTEPEHGSDPSALETTATPDGGDWVLNGTKAWITNGSIAGVAVVWCRTPDGIRGFLIDQDRPGFSTREIKDKLSLRASVTSELIFQDCRVPGGALLPGATGLRAALSCLTEARFGIAFGAVGAAMACYESALNYAKLRVQFGKPIAAFQLTQEKLVEMLTGTTQGQLLALQLGRLKEAGRLRHQQVSLAKRANVAMALDVARVARSILGANGISLEHPIFRHMVNLESVYTYEGTHEVHTLVVGQDVTGLSAF
ncbi:MAG: acyl-CoA dehydrogenase family protein [Chloroflexi bacterium]|nr:acyl-CoA dehydrogenase family protein [Chloroflexota bacterium]